MRRRRRTRGTWFPTIGTFIADEDSTSGKQFVLAALTTGAINTIIAPVTLDRPREGDDVEDDSLADIIGSEYILQRIVGKLHAYRTVDLAPGSAAHAWDNAPAVLLGCRFFVARANDNSSGGGEDTPIGSASATERNDNYSPLEADTVREPWIWRRTWILGCHGNNVSPQVDGQFYGGATDSPAQPQGAFAFPPSTALYGSVMDGPHIDSKVKRRIRQDDRLWFAVSTCMWPINTAINTERNIGVRGFLDYRLFGSLRKARNTSAF